MGKTNLRRWGILAMVLVAARVPWQQKELAQGTAGDEVEIRALVKKFFEFAEGRDLAGLMSLWSETSTEKEAARQRFENILRPGGVFEAKGIGFEKVEVRGDKATVLVRGEFIVLLPGMIRPAGLSGETSRLLSLTREMNQWRIGSYGTNGFEFAAKLAAVNGDKQRREIFRVSADLVSMFLEKGLLLEAIKLSKAGKTEGALEVLVLADEIAEQINDQAGKVHVLHDIGFLQCSRGEYGLAIKTLDKALKIQPGVKANESSARLVASIWYWMGKAHYSLGQYSQAKECYSGGLGIADKTGAKDLVVTCLLGLGNSEYGLKNYDGAADSYERSLKVSGEIVDKRDLAAALHSIGGIRNRQSDYASSISLYQDTLKIREELRDDAGISDVLISLAVTYSNLGDYKLALEKCEEALRIKRNLGDKKGVGAVLAATGYVHLNQGDYDRASENLETALKIRKEIDDKWGIAQTLGDLGQVKCQKGDYQEALLLFQESSRISREIRDGWGIAASLHNVGIVQKNLGNYQQAVEYEHQSLKLWEEMGVKSWVGTVIWGLGSVDHRRGNYRQALEYYQKSLEIDEAIGRRADAAILLGNIGEVRYAMGDYEHALEDHTRALEVKQQVGDRVGVAATLADIGEIYLFQGKYQQAAEMEDRAAGMLRAIGHREELVDALIRAGRTYGAMKQLDSARERMAEAIRVVEELVPRTAGRLDQEHYFEERVSPYYGMIDLLVDQNDLAGAFATSERAKARVLLDALSSGKINVNKAETAEEKAQERRINSELVALNSEMLRLKVAKRLDEKRLAGLNAKLEKTRLEREAFQTSLYAAHPDLRVQRGQFQPISLEQCTELFTGIGSAVLEFVVSDDRTILFVLAPTQGGPLRLTSYEMAVKKEELAQLVDQFRSRLARRDSSRSESAAKLYNLVLRRAANELDGKANLVIVPDGPLWDLPFQALQPAPGHYLIEDHSVSYAPSLTALREMVRTSRRHQGQPATTLIGLGNPVVHSDNSGKIKQAFMDAELGPLPQAETQIKAIGRLYGPARSKIYVGKDATEDRLKAEAGNCQILHIAGHGIVNNASPMYSQIVLSRAKGSDDDGILEAWEILNMDLKADLAVLSACDTARGHIGAGEGVIGLSWAFFVAGCPATVVSQWSVDANSTSKLMVEFHRNLLAGKSKAEALRQAELKLLKSGNYSDPFYWAGFVVIGNGGELER